MDTKQLVKQVKEHFPDLSFEIIEGDDFDQIRLKDIGLTFPILERMTNEKLLNFIKLTIKKKERDPFCGICFRKIDLRISCFQCTSDFCIFCYSKITISNKSKLVCPFCRFETGLELYSKRSIYLCLYINIVNLSKGKFINNFRPVDFVKGVVVAIDNFTFYDDEKKQFAFDSNGMFKAIDNEASGSCRRTPENRVRFILKLYKNIKKDQMFILISNLDKNKIDIINYFIVYDTTYKLPVD